MLVLDGNNSVRCVVTNKLDLTWSWLFACHNFPTSWNGGVRLDSLVSLPVDSIRLDGVTILVPVNDVSLLVVCCVSDRDGLTDSHFGKHCVVIYDNLTKGLEFAGTSIDVTYRFYDENGQLITLNLKDSYIVPASLNNHGNDKESQTGVNIESVELLSDGKAEQLLGSSVAVDGNNEYSNHFNDGDWDQSVTDDPHGKRTYGSGLFNVSGNHVTLRFYTQVSPDVAASLNKLTPDEWNNGSMWAIVQTVIPTYDDPVPPVKKNSNAKVAYHDVELHVNGSQHVTVNMPNGKTTTTPADQSYQFTKSANGRR